MSAVVVVNVVSAEEINNVVDEDVRPNCRHQGVVMSIGRMRSTGAGFKADVPEADRRTTIRSFFSGITADDVDAFESSLARLYAGRLQGGCAARDVSLAVQQMFAFEPGHDHSEALCSVLLDVNVGDGTELARYLSHPGRSALLSVAIASWTGYWQRGQSGVRAATSSLPETAEASIGIDTFSTSPVDNVLQLVSATCIPSADLQHLVPRVGIPASTCAEAVAMAIGAERPAQSTARDVPFVVVGSDRESVRDTLDRWEGVDTRLELSPSVRAYTTTTESSSVLRVPYTLVAATSSLASSCCELFSSRLTLQYSVPSYYKDSPVLIRQDPASSRIIFPCNALLNTNDGVPPSQMEVLCSLIGSNDDMKKSARSYMKIATTSLRIPMSLDLDERITKYLFDVQFNKLLRYPRPIIQVQARLVTGTPRVHNEFLSLFDVSRPFYAVLDARGSGHGMEEEGRWVPVYAMYMYTPSGAVFVAPAFVHLPPDVQRVSNQVSSTPEVVWPKYASVEDLVAPESIRAHSTPETHLQVVLVPNNSTRAGFDVLSVCYLHDLALDAGLCTRILLFAFTCGILDGDIVSWCETAATTLDKLGRKDLLEHVRRVVAFTSSPSPIAPMYTRLIGGDVQKWGSRDEAVRALLGHSPPYGSVVPPHDPSSRLPLTVRHVKLKRICGRVFRIHVERPRLRPLAVVDDAAPWVDSSARTLTVSPTLSLRLVAAQGDTPQPRCVVYVSDDAWYEYSASGVRRLEQREAQSFIQDDARLVVYTLQ